MIENVFSGPYLRRLDNIKQWSEKDTLKTESVSQHSYKVAVYTTVILEEMLGKEELAERLQGFKLKCIQYALFHDWDESLIKRDISHETKYNKWNGDEFRALLDRFSAHAAMLEFDQKYINGENEASILIINSIIRPDKDVKAVVKFADWLAMLAYLQRERALGNHTLDESYEYCVKCIVPAYETLKNTLRKFFIETEETRLNTTWSDELIADLVNSVKS